MRCNNDSHKLDWPTGNAIPGLALCAICLILFQPGEAYMSFSKCSLECTWWGRVAWLPWRDHDLHLPTLGHSLR